MLLGEYVSDATDFQERVAGIRGHNLAKAGVEMALWDLLGKRQTRSLRELLGGTAGTCGSGCLGWHSGFTGGAG